MDLNPSHLRTARPTLSCVVPAYNEAANLGRVLHELCTLLTELTDSWEVIVVDDGSRDATALVMAPWLQRGGVRYVRLSRNFGKEAALSAGIDRAEGEVVVLMDADGQHPVALLPRMLEVWRDGADMVCAVRESRGDESVLKRLGTRLFYRAVNLHAEVRIPEDAGDFRLMDRRVVLALRSLPERNRFMKGLYAWVGFRTELLPYQPAERLAGRSSFSLTRLAKLAFTGVTAFSNAPLRLWSALGALIALGSLLFGAWITVDHMVEGHDVPGWATLVVSIAFLGGVQLLSIGILGEYIGRIFNEVKRRPLYLVAEEGGCAVQPRAPQPRATMESPAARVADFSAAVMP